MSNIDKFRAALTKKGAKVGFAPVRGWISTGNMAINYVISNSMTRGFPVSRLSFLSGPRGSGKSFIVGNAMKAAQDDGYHVILIESENSIDREFLERIGVDTEDKFDMIRVFSIEEATELCQTILTNFDKDDKVFLFVDSLSNLESSQETDKFDKEGVIASTQGLVQKKMKALCSLLNNRVGDRNMGVLMTTHVYLNQEQYGDKYKVSGGESIQFLPSIGVWTTALPLREGSNLVGIRLKCKTYKTRYQQTGMDIEVDLPYTTGMDKYDGILPILVKLGVIEQGGSWYSVLDSATGEVVKFQKKNLDAHINTVIKRYDELIEQIDEKEDDVASLESEKMKKN